jgi:N-methylhydantoinase A
LLGRIASDAKLGGRLALDKDAATAAVRGLAERLGLPLVEAALGIVRIAEEVMAGAIRTVSVEQGSDPGGSWLVAFGGAGGLHATSLAKALGMAGVVVPPFSGVFSAVGLLLAPPRSDATRAVLVASNDFAPIEAAAGELDVEVRSALARTGFTDVSVSFSVDMRYLGQAHEISVAWSPGEGLGDVRDRFDETHRERNGFNRLDDPVEIVAVRSVAVARPALNIHDVSRWRATAERSDMRRDVIDLTGPVSALVVHRDALQIGDSVEGPAIVEEAEATTYLAIGDHATVTASGSLEVTW